MATTDKASTRDRLLDAAAEIFYREGVSVGVETLCRSAGVSKRSMYQLFASKGEVLAASLARRLPEYEARLVPGAQEQAGPPRERILHVFERLEKASAEPAYQVVPTSPRWSSSGIPNTRRVWSPVGRRSGCWASSARTPRKAGRGTRSCSPAS
jgi:AcrR family transcriptional regulator